MQLPGTDKLWIGRDHVMAVQVNEQNVIQRIWVVPYFEDDGGIGPWIKQQYREWFPGTTPPTPVAIPLAPPPGLPPLPPVPTKPGP